MHVYERWHTRPHSWQNLIFMFQADRQPDIQLHRGSFIIHYLMNSAGPFTFWLSAHLYACVCVFVCTVSVPLVCICTSEFHFLCLNKGEREDREKDARNIPLSTPLGHMHTLTWMHGNLLPLTNHKICAVWWLKKKYRWQRSVTISDINSEVIGGKLFKAISLLTDGFFLD